MSREVLATRLEEVECLFVDLVWGGLVVDSSHVRIYVEET